MRAYRSLAMLAFAGFAVQHITTGTTPLKNLSTHLAVRCFHARPHLCLHVLTAVQPFRVYL